MEIEVGSKVSSETSVAPQTVWSLSDWVTPTQIFSPKTDTRPAVSHNRTVSVPSKPATCFGSADRHQESKQTDLITTHFESV